MKKIKLDLRIEGAMAQIEDHMLEEEENDPFCPGCGVELCPCGYCHMPDCTEEKTDCE